MPPRFGEGINDPPMTSEYENLAAETLQTATAVGAHQLSPEQAITTLESSAAKILQLKSITEIWQITQESSKVLSILFPQHAEVFEGEDPRIPTSLGAIPLRVSTKVLIRQVLSVMKLLHTDATAKQGAASILSEYPNPLPKSASPFADSRGIWNHTHDSDDEK